MENGVHRAKVHGNKLSFKFKNKPLLNQLAVNSKRGTTWCTTHKRVVGSSNQWSLLYCTQCTRWLVIFYGSWWKQHRGNNLDNSAHQINASTEIVKYSTVSIQLMWLLKRIKFRCGSTSSYNTAPQRPCIERVMVLLSVPLWSDPLLAMANKRLDDSSKIWT